MNDSKGVEWGGRPWHSANDLPYQGQDTDPFRALRDTMAFSSNDWASARDFAWLYGIVCGWSDEDEDSHSDIAARFGWSNAQVERLRELHEEFHAAAATYQETHP